MSVLTRMYRGETHFDFVGIARRSLWVSLALVVLSLALLLLRPLNLSIDFTGGVIITVENPSDASVGSVRNALTAVGEGGAKFEASHGC